MNYKILTEYIEEHGSITHQQLINLIKRDRLLDELINKGYDIVFNHDELTYNIFWSDSNEGYMIDIYKSMSHYNEDESLPINGGLCTGSELDALEFFINWDEVSND